MKYSPINAQDASEFISEQVISYATRTINSPNSARKSGSGSILRIEFLVGKSEWKVSVGSLVAHQGPDIEEAVNKFNQIAGAGIF